MSQLSRSAWEAERLAARLPYLRRRALLTAGVRAFFSSRFYLEVETPYAVAAPGEEVHLRAISLANGQYLQNRYLHTSPEFSMKKLLAGGAGKIFQLARVWRDEPASDTHEAEFTMLEWYTTGAGLSGLMDEVESLLRAVLPPQFERRGQTISLASFERLTVAEAFARHAGVPDLLSLPETPAALAAAAGANLRGGETWEDLFFRLLLERIEPHIGRGHPVFLTHWPASQAALARRCPQDPRAAERFELYLAGIELANAFVELTDAAEQRARFIADRARRHALYGPDWQLDEAFLAAVAQLPPCAGCAMGFDRLAMLASGAPRLQDVIWLPS
jgi:lysyl-tRNA synthetase class 2